MSLHKITKEFFMMTNKKVQSLSPLVAKLQRDFVSAMVRVVGCDGTNGRCDLSPAF